jgi:phosphohistidine phosphatase
MKTIYLIRHAESNWKRGVKDFDRPLNEKGVLDAIYIGKKLRQFNFNPNQILCSPALRTKNTAELLCNKTECSSEKIIYNTSIYNASLVELTSLLNTFQNKYNNLAIIGHNPGITELANYLTDDFLPQVVPCSVIKIELEIDSWDEVIQGIGIVKFNISP